MAKHYFDSTSEAYDATQCGTNWHTDEDINFCDILIIESEKVIGLAYTWPLSISKEHGELHQTTKGHALIDILYTSNKCIPEGFTQAMISAAIIEAMMLSETKGWGLHVTV